MNKEKITCIGAGLAGPLMASYLAQQGYTVDIYEQRSDLRKVTQSAGRSINLALSARGIHALKEVGIYDQIKPFTIPMKGRMIHDKNGETHLQAYGQNKNEMIYSVSRAQLNMDLMTLAEETGKVEIHFNQQLEKADLINNKLNFGKNQVSFEKIIGCDGSASPLRKAIIENSKADYLKKPLGHGYKELVIPPSESGDYLLEPNVLHIWPRGKFMLIALPNLDRTFTCTLFLPVTGTTSFESIKNEIEIIELFHNYFPDALEIMPTLCNDFQNNPIGILASVYCDPWHVEDKAVLIGDAAHAVVPFFGQGMNASFQDCSVLNSLIMKYDGDWTQILNEYSSKQIENGYAIADMAIENYLEMRDAVNDPVYQKRRNLELELERKFPDRFIPRYSMVSFHQIPYAEVYRRGEIQLKLMNQFLSNEIIEPELYQLINSQLNSIL
ncbi:MAG: FAD-dependent monooxygenase [Candidatus Marinimicrobia bacterium]|jgi:kynurenine 3-monooxygenase|nr:FAD-dependent monooxygenase [Candidatus Neomarinimicrobiota bacterium]MBT3501335.1 FAD-dependent monooxygenase [Candidatus Neomarinimicrobiota bacterium]MBT3838535.1 FAD-dependent monooxygenase [Candidatus Neomarinimicrobiota bacterium]MBT3999917.1 FAD-dependent monooxygenase [Candidatus Neomarinimicrobiota bacterium]MBT4282566.1 FAD-dependent monooxygenase [Candidatus Neomarinimicrobiota bacterium]